MQTSTSAPRAAAHRATNHRLYFAAALLIGLAACGGGGGGNDTAAPAPTASGGGQPTAEATYSLRVDPNPIVATPATDDARQVAQDLPLEGGTLSATGADGTVYTLTVPANALEQATRITMTPLARVAGLPFGEDVRGVQLGPDGLQFASFVRLNVALPAGTHWPVEQQVPISMQGSRNIVSLAPLDSTSEAPSFQLLHFSSYALVLASKGLNASLEGLRQRLGGSEDERLTSALSGLLAAERVRALSGQPGNTLADALIAMMQEFEKKVLAPRLAAASSSCAASRLALQTTLGLERSRQLLGLPESGSATAATHAALFATSAQVCMKEEFEICRDVHIVTRIVPARLGVERQLALLGILDQVPLEADAYVEKCLRFAKHANPTAEAGQPA